MRLALLGGGRWARIHATVLHQILATTDEVFWVSEHSREAVTDQLNRFEAPGPEFHLMSDRDDALRKGIDAAIIVTSPHRHVADATAALDHGASVLVEKPLALDIDEASRLIELAARRERALGIGLTFTMAPAFREMGKCLQGRTPKRIDVRWFDPPFERRYGEVKATDLTVHKVHDTFPHHWSVFNAILPGHAAGKFNVSCGPLGSVNVDFHWGELDATLALGRRGKSRERQLTVHFEDGGSAELDFGVEPGTLRIDGRDESLAIKPDAMRPLTAELVCFLEALAKPVERETWPLAAKQCVGSVTGAVALHDGVCKAEAVALALLLKAGQPDADPDIIALLVDNLGPELAGRQRLTLYDEEAIRRLAREGLDAIRQPAKPSNIFSGSPWIASIREITQQAR